jgi:hypothetical protein
MHLLALSAHTGTWIAELAFVLILIGGCALALARMRALSNHRAVTLVAGSAFALAGLLLIVATHWGHFT